MAHGNVRSGFFAYGSSPFSIPTTIREAIEQINKTHHTILTSWESLEVGGRYIVRTVCDAIDDADFFCADITTINPNVMFELGFAIGRDKRIWLVRDDSYVDAKAEFEQLRLLTTVGYRPYTNSDQIVKSFFADSPHSTLDQTVFRESIEPLLGPSTPPVPFVYLKSRHDTEASVRVSRVAAELTPPPVLDDPRESSVQPLYWYGQKLLHAPGLIAHFLSNKREGSKLTNARYALVCGLCAGFDTPVLMLSEQNDLLSPMDYRDQMQYYTTPPEAGRLTDQWLQAVASAAHISVFGSGKPSVGAAVRLATELKGFHQQLGEYVAENEASQLSHYFVETTAHMDIINGTQTIFVGRKGTGKTASLIQAAEDIGKEANNIVCVLKPVGYEMAGLVRLFADYETRDRKGYVIESLWKYMLYTELAQGTAKHIRDITPWASYDLPYSKLIRLIEEENRALAGDFNVRLEAVITALTSVKPNDSADKFEKGMSEALHNTLISRLRSLLLEVFAKKHQIILLIDNLDKPWTKQADVVLLTHFLVGLLTAAGRVSEELRQYERGRQGAKFTCAVFLRSDIFNRIVESADEPDKISHTRLDWSDSELLLRVIEERYVAAHGPNSDPADMWHKYFCPQVKGLPTRDYLVSRILPRPRDIVYFVKAAVSFAVNRRRDRVEEKDVLDAEMQYSQYAWDSILVENSGVIPELENTLLHFVGGESVIPESVLRRYVSSSGIEAERVDRVISHLVGLTFLGVEVSPGRFAYADEKKQLQKNLALAARLLSTGHSEPRYEVNAPFRAYLGLMEKREDGFLDLSWK
jgi:hypothetical protein